MPQNFTETALAALRQERLKATYPNLFVGKSWGIDALDTATGGIKLPSRWNIEDGGETVLVEQKACYYIVQGMQKMGKTAMLVTIMLALKKQNVPFLYISNEQDESTVAMLAMIASQDLITRSQVRDFNVAPGEFKAIEPLAKGWDAYLHFNIANVGEIEPMLVQINSERAQDNPVSVVLLDYYQIIDPIERQKNNRVLELDMVSRSIATLKTKGYSIILAAQEKKDMTIFGSTQGAKDTDGSMSITPFKHETGRIDKTMSIIKLHSGRQWPEAEVVVNHDRNFSRFRNSDKKLVHVDFSDDAITPKQTEMPEGL